MKNKKVIAGLMAMTVVVGLGIISLRLNKQKDSFFEKGVGDEKDNCVTVTQQNENVIADEEPNGAGGDGENQNQT